MTRWWAGRLPVAGWWVEFSSGVVPYVQVRNTSVGWRIPHACISTCRASIACSGASPTRYHLLQPRVRGRGPGATLLPPGRAHGRACSLKPRYSNPCFALLCLYLSTVASVTSAERQRGRTVRRGAGTFHGNTFCAWLEAKYHGLRPKRHPFSLHSVCRKASPKLGGCGKRW